MPDPTDPKAGETPPAAAHVTPPPAVDTAPAKVDMTSEQLSARLKEERGRARDAFIKDLGFEKPDDLRTALADLKTLKGASLSEKERLEARIKELEPAVAKATGTTELLKLVVDEQFSKLPESVQKVIDETADGDPEQRLLLMRVVAAATAAPPADPNAPPPPPAGPKNVSPKPNPPPQGQETAWDKFQALSKKSGLLADIFFNANRREIEASRPADTQQ